MTLDVGALAGSSEVDACVLNNGWPALNVTPVVTRGYEIAGLRLNLSAPAIEPMTSSVKGVLEGVARDVSGLESPSVSLTAPIDTGLAGLVTKSGSTLGVGGITNEIIFGDLNLTATEQLLGKTLTDGVVTIDLASAEIYFNLAELIGDPEEPDEPGLTKGFNGRNPNTRLVLDDAAVQNLTQRTTELLSDWRDEVAAEVQKALTATSFKMTTTVRLLTLAGVPVADVVLGYDTTVGAFLPKSPVVPPPAPTLSTTVLDLRLPGLGLLLPDLAALLDPVTDALVGGTGGVVAGALDTALTATGGLLPTAEAAIRAAVVPVTEQSVTALAPLADTLTLTVNVQPDQPGAPAGSAAAGSSREGEYKVSALRVGAVGSTAELYLATASAGPVVFRPAAG
jgi:hypothetical protein